MTGEIVKEIYNSSTSHQHMPENLIKAIKWLQDRLADVPEDMRQKARIYLDVEWECETPYVCIQIIGKRDETETERIEREGREFARRRDMILQQEAQEYAEYEKLKRKYGNVR